jgi:hypothetical protein
MDKIKIYYVDNLPGKFRGMCIPPFGIFILKKHRGNKKILQHDLVHWKQYKKLGFLDFYLKYLIQYIFIGYENMPMEIEARQNEPLHIRNNYVNTYLK